MYTSYTSQPASTITLLRYLTHNYSSLISTGSFFTQLLPALLYMINIFRCCCCFIHCHHHHHHWYYCY